MEGLPFWEMRPSSELISGGEGYAFAKRGELYAVYLPNGGTISLDLSGASGPFRASWFNPRDGSSVERGQVSGDGHTSLTSPFAGDSVLLLASE